MQIINCEQGTAEWFEARDFTMTASNAATIAVGGKGLETYIKKLAQEHYSSGERSNYENDDIKRGHELEPLSRQMYEFENNTKIEQVGFIKNRYIGCSPDGLIEEDGGWENKAPSDKTYFEYLLDETKEPDPDYVAQCQMSLYITKRKYWILEYYNPNYKVSKKTWKILPDLEFHKKLELGIEKGIKLIEEIKSKLD